MPNDPAGSRGSPDIRFVFSVMGTRRTASLSWFLFASDIPKHASGRFIVAVATALRPDRRREPHRRRLLGIAFGTDCLCRAHRRDRFRAPLQTGSQFIKCRSLGHTAYLAEQVIGERHARQRRTRFEATMQRIRHIANLDHRGHAQNVNRCGLQINLLPAGAARADPAQKRRPVSTASRSRYLHRLRQELTGVRTVRPSCRRTARRVRHRRDSDGLRRRRGESDARSHRPSYHWRQRGSRRPPTAAL